MAFRAQRRFRRFRKSEEILGNGIYILRDAELRLGRNSMFHD